MSGGNNIGISTQGSGLNTPAITSPPSAASNTPSGRKRGAKGSKLAPQHGQRQFKVYPVSEEQLGMLAGIGLAASIAFAFTTGLWGECIDIYQDLSLEQDLPIQVVQYWRRIMFACLFFSILNAFV